MSLWVVLRVLFCCGCFVFLVFVSLWWFGICFVFVVILILFAYVWSWGQLISPLKRLLSPADDSATGKCSVAYLISVCVCVWTHWCGGCEQWAALPGTFISTGHKIHSQTNISVEFSFFFFFPSVCHSPLLFPSLPLFLWTLSDFWIITLSWEERIEYCGKV